MTFDLEVGGRRRAVTVVRTDGLSQPGHLRVLIRDDASGEAQAFDVEARGTAAGVSWIYLDDRRSVDAVVLRGADACVVDLAGAALTVRLDGKRAPSAGQRGGTEQRLTAPLPGRIVKVLVAVGVEVAARQDLVVIEAMKMENALQSTLAGRVKEVHVSDGTSVEAGRLLIVIAPVE
jgi:biotin carboxyl carrier protein